jgi:hypothetical protein
MGRRAAIHTKVSTKPSPSADRNAPVPAEQLPLKAPRKRKNCEESPSSGHIISPAPLQPLPCKTTFKRKNSEESPHSNEVSPPKAARKGKSPYVSMAQVAALQHLPSDEPPINHTIQFSPNSTVHLTWGLPQSGPSPAIQMSSRRKNLARSSRAKTAKRQPLAAVKLTTPKSAVTPYILQLPLEIREVIYSYLVVHSGPVLHDSDLWCCSTRSRHGCQFFRTCHQISEEVFNYFYRSNTLGLSLSYYGLWGLKRLPSPPAFLRPGAIYNIKWPGSVRNIAIDCDLISWSLQWLEQVAALLMPLVNAGASIETLTLVIKPESVLGYKPITECLKISAATFANCYWLGSEFMKRLSKLSCKVLNVVVNLWEGLRALISIDVGILGQEIRRKAEDERNREADKENIEAPKQQT